MGCQHTGELFHLFCLKVHYDTGGNPIAIIGNLSNTIGPITKAEFSLFTVVGEKSDAPPTHGDTIDPTTIANTSLNANTKYVVYLINLSNEWMNEWIFLSSVIAGLNNKRLWSQWVDKTQWDEWGKYDDVEQDHHTKSP